MRYRSLDLTFVWNTAHWQIQISDRSHIITWAEPGRRGFGKSVITTRVNWLTEGRGSNIYLKWYVSDPYSKWWTVKGTNGDLSEVLRKCHHGCLHLINLLLHRAPPILPLYSQVLFTVCLTICRRFEDYIFHLLTDEIVDDLAWDVCQHCFRHFLHTFL